MKTTPRGGAPPRRDLHRRWRVLRPEWGVYRGLDAIERVAGALRATRPNSHYQPIAGPEEVGNGGQIQWVEGRPGEKPVVAGTDFIIARDGRIAALYLFFDKLP